MLTRLDASYDLVFIDADPIDQPDYVAECFRDPRSSSHRAALGGRAGDPGARRRGDRGEAARLIAEEHERPTRHWCRWATALAAVKLVM